MHDDVTPGGWDKERVGTATLGVWGGEAGAGEVFTAASTDWVHGLAGADVTGETSFHPHEGVSLSRDPMGEPDPTVERVTLNVLCRLGGIGATATGE